jgi:hypothetical protein
MKDFKKMPKMACGGKVKKFSDGGSTLEEMYPEAKITKAGPQPKPKEYSANRFKVGESNWESSQKSARADARTLAPYESKAPSMGRGGGGSGTGGAAAEIKMLNNPRAIKKGGSVRRNKK